ncbi:hypothetical protein BDV59DRAFT_188173 [Aspergillus ambiguus]|uniref:uncharacterized protein n=1 Tax=Aspergillus ambiguus TaxID=176160 RepID=UPI003CCCB7E7
MSAAGASTLLGVRTRSILGPIVGLLRLLCRRRWWWWRRRKRKPLGVHCGGRRSRTFQDR